MLEKFEIGGREVGGNAPLLFIAEAGVSHFGDMDLAEQLVDLAADAGADVFKTQFFDVDMLFAKSASAWRDRLRPRNLTFDQARALKDRCDRRGILFMSTAHDESRLRWLADLDVPAIKVGSGERNNTGFLEKLARLGKPMIVSTGMYREADVVEAVEACRRGGCERVALLHCVTSYPAPAADINLRAMDRMRQIFPGPVGYSDHTEDHLAVHAAAARGAKIIEKHITILRNVPNAQDWKVSAGPEDLAKLVADLRRVEALLGSGRKEPAASEAAGQDWALKALVARRNLPAGHVVEEADIVAKRPSRGIPPNRIAEVIGKRLPAALAADDPLPEALIG
ncbi:MAG: N-acetylneuraminate synthase family protein [Rhodospirillales bacterium]|nr:N-acetylneuraminate synthase family protein [Rhodospirillales bacterium]